MGILYILFSAFLQLVQFSLGAIIRKKTRKCHFFKKQSVLCILRGNSLIVTDVFPCSSAPRKLWTLLWEKTPCSHLAPLMSTHVVDLAG